ncbi:MAG: hypothetical protein V3U93_03580 [Alphaproteobacteria bacterium]
MVKRTLAAAVVLAFVSGPALAGHCPKDVKRIDAALAKNPSLSSAQISEVKKLRDQGSAAHKSGKHGAALEALHKAMGTLDIKH